MKSKIKVLGIIVLAAVVGFSLIACSEPATLGSITITNIPAQFDGKFAMLTLDTGGSGARNVAWATRTITGTSATFSLLDWVTDQPTKINDGNYGVNIIVAANMQAIADDLHDFIGIIMSKALAGETVSVEWGELMDMTN